MKYLLPVILLASCSVSLGEEPAEIGVTVAIEPAQTFATDDGAEVEVVSGGLVCWSGELLPCEPEPRGYAFDFYDLLIPSAYAHGENTPTAFSDPVVADLVAPGTFEMGRFRPTDGTYCAIELLARRADADTRGIEDASQMMDETLMIELLVDGEPRRLATGLNISQRFDLDEPFDPYESDDLEVLVTLDVEAALRATDLDADDPGRQLATNLRQTLRVERAP